MLTSTFVLLQGVGPVTERRWWQEGVLDWHSFMSRPRIAGLSPDRKSLYNDDLSQALAAFEAKDFSSLAARLPGREHWRFYDTCRSTALYLDIETTGLSPHDPAGAVTVVGLHRNGSTTTLIQGDTLTTDRLQAELDGCTLLVTFFGSVFDVPYLRAKFPRLRFPMPHFDLCLAARRLGMHGGLKHLEQELGLGRAPALCGLDGLDAVRLWSRWRLGDHMALDVLLAYNRADTESLVPLAALVYKEMMSRFGLSVSTASRTSYHSLTAYAP
ncbi:MAG TPA: ribonuclease H-like domain-containing protein [Nitrospira sp.]|nr:ribonuclease H-like domain-containing protein [Nitrospira sp.]